MVAEAISVTGVVTNNGRGADRVSDSGGNTVTIQGSGFWGKLHVHWFEAAAGFAPNSGNEVRSARLTGQGLRFSSPQALHGKQYRIVVRRPETNETVTAAALLSGVDDTRPRATSTCTYIRFPARTPPSPHCRHYQPRNALMNWRACWAESRLHNRP